jgi:DegV family protein with EDD domain
MINDVLLIYTPLYRVSFLKSNLVCYTPKLVKEAPPHIVTDSTSDIPVATAHKLQIDVVPAKIMFGKYQYSDGVDMNAKQFLTNLVDPSFPHPTTSSPGFGPFYNLFEKHPEPILSIIASKDLSSFHDHSILATRETGRTNITTYDSMSSTLGLGFLVMEAARLAKEGYSTNEILPLLDSIRARTYVVALLDTLKYLQRSGRMNLPTMWIGTALDLKPIIQLKDGTISKIDAVRTKGKATPKYIEWIKIHAPFEKVAVVHADNKPLADEIADNLSSDFEKTQILITDVTPALVVHAGPKAVGVIFTQAK